MLAGEELPSEEDFFPRQDGCAQWARWSIKPWRTEDGRIGGALLYAEVMSDQVAARRALIDSERQFQVTFENAPIGLAHNAPDGRFLRVNEMMCRILGYSADDLTTKSYREITHPDDLEASVVRFELLRDGKIDRYDAEWRLLRRNGVTTWTRVTVSGVHKSDRSIDYIIAVIEDISARKREEEELRKSEEQFRSLRLASANRPLRRSGTNPRDQRELAGTNRPFEGGIAPTRGLDDPSLSGTLGRGAEVSPRDHIDRASRDAVL
jgi:PAS domain S-box-containing protein